jgi:hypothetical protein
MINLTIKYSSFSPSTGDIEYIYKDSKYKIRLDSIHKLKIEENSIIKLENDPYVINIPVNGTLHIYSEKMEEFKTCCIGCLFRCEDKNIRDCDILNIANDIKNAYDDKTMENMDSDAKQQVVYCECYEKWVNSGKMREDRFDNVMNHIRYGDKIKKRKNTKKRKEQEEQYVIDAIKYKIEEEKKKIIEEKRKEDEERKKFYDTKPVISNDGLHFKMTFPPHRDSTIAIPTATIPYGEQKINIAPHFPYGQQAQNFTLFPNNNQPTGHTNYRSLSPFDYRHQLTTEVPYSDDSPYETVDCDYRI